MPHRYACVNPNPSALRKIEPTFHAERMLSNMTANFFLLEGQRLGLREGLGSVPGLRPTRSVRFVSPRQAGQRVPNVFASIRGYLNPHDRHVRICGELGGIRLLYMLQLKPFRGEMHRIVPELIVENYRLGRYSGDFPAVALFLDLSGFSTMTDSLMQHGQHGAEVLAGLMHGVFDPLVESIFAYGGKIVSFAGDGIMALFPIESDEMSAALIALASASEIQHRLEENPVRQTIYGKFQFSVKIGLAIGTVAWGILRSDDHQNATYYFRGSPVDESAEAEHRASAGQIILADRINELLKDAIQTRPIDSFHQFIGFRVEMPIGIPTVFPPVDLEISRIFMPESVIARDVRGEFRQIVNLFMRFPDLSHERLQDFVRVIFDLQKKYSGLISRLDFGDKGCNMLVLWGAPVAHENDISRALNFILDLQPRVNFPITAGVTYYIAHAGYLGSEMYEDYTCYGWGINLASRFMMSAPPGQIWVDDRIARRVAKRFDLSYIGEQQFKGFSAEQRVNSLHGFQVEAELPYQGEFIGREKELSVLVDFVKPLWIGKFTGTLLVLGEAGIGKGRFVHEFRSSEILKEKTILWAVCQSDQIVRQSFNPLRSWLMHHFGLTSAGNPAERKQIFETKLQELIDATADDALAQDLDRLYAALGALVDLHWADSLYEQLDAEGRYNSTLLALITLIKAESLRQPLILFIEDLQFIDSDTLNFLPRLRRSILASEINYPISIIATSRPQRGKPLPDDIVDVYIDLKSLGLEEVARLTEILLGGVPAVELIKLITERSEGNPFFVEQIIRYLQEEKFIEMSERGWNQVKRTREFFLPGDIRSLLVARLDQLAHEVQEIVHTASVLGREFAFSVLVEMVRGVDNIHRIVAAAQQSEIWVPQGENHFLFTHALLRDAAYTMQTRARRQELHRFAMNALEKIYANQLKFHYAELAYHAKYAELGSMAQKYYTLAGKAAAEAYQNHNAIDYYNRALAFTPVDNLETQFDLLTERVELFNRLGNRAAQLKDLTALEKLAMQLGDKTRLARMRMLSTVYHFMIGNYIDAISDATHAETLSDSIRETDLAFLAQTTCFLALLRLGRLEESMQRAQHTLEHVQRAGNRKEESRVLSYMGTIELERKEPAAAEVYLVKALEIAREVKDRGLETRALNNLAICEGAFKGDYATARDYYEKSYDIAREIGDRNAEGIALINLGFAAGMQGNFVAAHKLHAQALSIARETDNRYQETYTLINLSAAAEKQNDWSSALQYAREAAKLAQNVGDRSAEAWAMHYIGHAHLLMNDFEQAQEAFQKSIEIRNELGQTSLSMEPLAGLVDVALLINDLEFASRQAEKILAHINEGGTLDGTDEPLRVYYSCYRLLEKRQDPRAQQVLQNAIQLLETQVSKLRDEKSRRMFVENVPWRLALRNASQTFTQ